MERKYLSTVLLSLVIVGFFFGECILFHFPFGTGLDILELAGAILLPGLLLAFLLKDALKDEMYPLETLSLAGALGFGIVSGILSLFHGIGLRTYPFVEPMLLLVIFSGLVWNRHNRKRYFSGWTPAWNSLLYFSIGTLLFFAIYNLQQFHYGADGSIVTRGLFGIDLPFLAGEIHGIRDFGTLRDLHQSAQAWHYHDWTYQLLALLPRENTLPDLAFGTPFVGYVLLALSLFALVLRLTSSKYIAYISVGLWFLVSGIPGGELGSYALSPSFVFGSILFLNLLLVIDLRMKAKGRNAQWIYSGIFFLLLVELSQTKVSSYLAVVASIGVIGVMGLIVSPNKRRTIVEMLGASAASLAVVLWQNSGPNPLMPSGDFLIGAPLLGYANHVASIVHLPVSTINPVSQGLSLRWQSLLIVPFFLFHVLRFAVLDPKLLSALIMLIVFRKRLWTGSHELMWVLVLLLVIGFLLPVIYSPAWYPLALSFYAPLVSVQAALLITAMGFGTFISEVPIKNATLNIRTYRTVIGIIATVMLIGFSMNVHQIFGAEGAKEVTIKPELIHAMNYIETHTPDSSIVLTKRCDFDTSGDESFYWYSALTGRTVVSEGAKYGSLLAAVADTNSEKGLHPVPAAQRLLADRRAGLDTVFRSHNLLAVEAVLDSTHPGYILETPEDSAIMLRPSSYADSVFSENGYTVWRVRRFRIVY